jgi:hypothetical protein
MSRTPENVQTAMAATSAATGNAARPSQSPRRERFRERGLLVRTRDDDSVTVTRYRVGGMPLSGLTHAQILRHRAAFKRLTCRDGCTKLPGSEVI